MRDQIVFDHADEINSALHDQTSMEDVLLNVFEDRCDDPEDLALFRGLVVAQRFARNRALHELRGIFAEVRA